MTRVPIDQVDHDAGPSTSPFVTRRVGAGLPIRSKHGVVSHPRRGSPENRRSHWRYGTVAAAYHAGETTVLLHRERRVWVAKFPGTLLLERATSKIYVNLDNHTREDGEVGTILPAAAANWCCLPRTATTKRKEVQSEAGFAPKGAAADSILVRRKKPFPRERAPPSRARCTDLDRAKTDQEGR